MGRKGTQRVHEFVDHLVDAGVRELATLDITADRAREVMTGVAHQLCARYGRTSMYVPAIVELELTRRDEEIWREYGSAGPDGVRPFTQARLAQISVARGLTVRHLHSIVGLARRREQAGRQGTLPGLDAA